MKKNKLSFFLIFATALIQTSCFKDKVEYYLFVDSSKGGSVSFECDNCFYQEDDLISLHANADNDFEFVSWSDGSTDNPYELVLLENITLSPIFKETKYILEISKVGQGEVLNEFEGQDNEFKPNTLIHLNSIPNKGWLFTHWSGDLNAITSEIEFIIQENKSVVANFIELPIITIKGDGYVNFDIVYNEANDPVAIKIKAKSNEGWEFDSFSNGYLSDSDIIELPLNFEGDIEVNFIKDQPQIFLAENGVTIKASTEAEIGAIEILNGEVYQIVDLTSLIEMIKNGNDLSKVVTTKITSMRELFKNNKVFNDDISSWDVSNVVDFSYMFMNSNFNNDLSFWDVGSAELMKGFFAYSNFNHNISEWDVSNVVDFSYMFTSTNFNEDLSDWDVSRAIKMKHMFSDSKFDRTIKDWNVSNVANMDSMFQGNRFFNQDISEWNVSNVTSMDYMFQNSIFNRDISHWCVSQIAQEPLRFRELGSITIENSPVWGTCPN